MSFNKKRPRQRSRPRPKQKLSSVQERRLLKIISVLCVIALLWILFAPGSGLVTYISKRSELRTLEKQTVQIEQENRDLQKDVDRLLNDPEYLERIAREKHGLLKNNERVFDFSRKKIEQVE